MRGSIRLMLASSVPIFVMAVAAVSAQAGWLPPKPADDHGPDQVPMSAQVVQAAAIDPKLIAAFHQLRANPPKIDATIALAKAGNPLAQTGLCAAYKIGRGVAADLNQALAWCRKAAELGYAPAQYEAALVLRASAEAQLPAVKAEAMHWLRQAAQQDAAFAYLTLSRLYAAGDGVAADTDIAQHLLESAGEIKGACAPLTKAAQLRAGFGVTADEAGANKLLQQAATAGCWPAQRTIAAYLSRGQGGLTADPTAAKTWSGKADAAELAWAFGQ